MKAASVRRLGEVEAQALVERRVARRPDRPGGPGRALGQHGAGGVAGGDEADQAWSGTFSACSCGTTSRDGRGELEISTTGPRSARNRAMASKAAGKLSRPLWRTPQTSQ